MTSTRSASLIQLVMQTETVTPPTDPRLSFNEAADIYDQVRPRYPAELFDELFELLPEQPSIIEVGPGTGQATGDLLSRGAVVHAIEIGPGMAAKLRSNVSSDRLRISVADFENEPTEAASADVVFSATAYHWVSGAAQADRPAELLRPGGVVAIVDSIQVSSPDDEGFFDAVQPIYDSYRQGHVGPPAPARGDVAPAMQHVLASDERFSKVTVRSYDWNQTYSAAEYRTLMLSYSGTQLMEERSPLGPT